MLRWPGDKIVLKPRTVPEGIPGPVSAPLRARPIAPSPAPSAPAVPGQTQDAPPAPAHRTVCCPVCRFEQPASPFGLSQFCRNCNRRIDLEAMGAAKRPEPVKPALRHIACPGCQATQEVPTNALSAFCQKCGKRINMQDYQIRGKFNGDIQTKGTLTVALGGDVRADVRVGNAIIEGKIVGSIQADEKVELRSTGFVRGDIVAGTIVVHDGATLLGRCETRSLS